MAYLIRTVVFLGAMGFGLWGLVSLPNPWGWLAIVAAFLIGGITSQTLFKRFATKQQIMDDLEARLHND